MQWYAKRWWLAAGLFVFTLVSLYLFFIDSYLEQHKQLKAAIISEQQMVLQLQKITRQEVDTVLNSKKSASFLEQLQASLQINGLVLQSVQVMNHYSANVVIQGDFFHFVEWLRRAAEQPSPFWIKHFNYQTNHLEAQIGWLEGVEVPTITGLPAMQTHESFCNAVKFVQEPIGSIQAMKLVGYIQRGDIATAFVATATGQLVNLEVGAIVGIERKTVQQIKPDRVIFTSGEVIK
jgi:hypothetical protein